MDPSGGLLVNIFAACEEGDTDKLAINLADLQQTQHSIDTPGVCVCALRAQQAVVCAQEISPQYSYKVNGATCRAIPPASIQQQQQQASIASLECHWA